MKKNALALLLAICIVLSAASCGSTNADTKTAAKAETETEMVKKAEEEAASYEEVKYKIYPAPDDAFVGDVMPMADENNLELYYLYDTNHNGQAYHPIHKFTTSNFYEYEDNGQMLGCGQLDELDPALGTGCVLKGQDGLYHCFYTGHNDSMGARGLGKECVMHAVSEDKENWTKLPEDTLFPAENYSSDDFRDPFVFWNQEEQCYWMLIAARESVLGGVVAKYTSTDLKDWTLCAPFYAPQSHYMLECPDLFQMGDYYYLFYSWDCVTYYAMSDSIDGPFLPPEDNVLDGAGFVFYAAKTAVLDGNRYLCGWIGRTDQKKDLGSYNWAGNMLIHQLVQKEDGTLGVREPESLSEYFTVEKKVSLVHQEGSVTEEGSSFCLIAEEGENAVANFGMRVPTMMLECDVTLDEAGYAGFAFGSGEDYSEYTGLVLDANNQCIHYEGTKLAYIADEEPIITTAFSFEPGATHHVKLICENEIVILYIDDTKALSSRIYHSIDGAYISIFANNTEAIFSNFSICTPD